MIHFHVLCFPGDVALIFKLFVIVSEGIDILLDRVFYDGLVFV